MHGVTVSQHRASAARNHGCMCLQPLHSTAEPGRTQEALARQPPRRRASVMAMRLKVTDAETPDAPHGPGGGLNEKHPQGAWIFENLVPGWGCCSGVAEALGGRALLEEECHWRRWTLGSYSLPTSCLLLLLSERDEDVVSRFPAPVATPPSPPWVLPLP